MLMKKLENLARELGYSVERKNREVKWIRNNNKKVYGISGSIQDAFEDISLDYKERISVPKRIP